MVPIIKWLIVGITMNVLAFNCDAARILAIFPSPSRSHMIFYEALSKELAARGHQLTVISSFPQDKILANYTDISVPPKNSALDGVDMFNFKATDMIGAVINMGAHTCEYYMEAPAIQNLIHDKEAQFDLIITSMFFSECFLGFVHKYQVPVVGMMPNGGMHNIWEAVGNTSPYSYVPNTMFKYSDHMNFKERLINTLSISIMKIIKGYIVIPKLDAMMRKYFSDFEPIPYVTEIQNRAALILLNTHVSISYPRPYTPNTIEVGGMHIRQPKKLPQDLQKFLDEAKEGVIYFSMGSNLHASQMSEEKRAAFISGFSKLKEKVLWKSNMETLPGLSSNVKLGKWLPQTDILAHPNVKVFITHGGLLSTQEAIYYHVPVIGIPIFADQGVNMYRAQQTGYGLLLEYSNVTSESVQWAVNTVQQDKSYQETINKLSALFRDKPRTPLEEAVYWTEYVMRHNGTAHMRSAALDLAWYQYFLLDVIAFLALCLLVISLVAYKFIKAVKNFICKPVCSKKLAQNKNEKKNK